MSRIRTIKPEWRTDEKLGACSDAARVLSVALITMADDYGRGRGSLAIIAAETWACELAKDDGAHASETLAKASRALRELVEMEYVDLYEVRGQRYFVLRNWRGHQKVDHPGRPIVPPPDSESDSEKPDENEDSRKPRAVLAKSSRESREGLVADLGPRTSTKDQEGSSASATPTPLPCPETRTPQPKSRTPRLDPLNFEGRPAEAAQAALSAACVAAGGVPRTRGGYSHQAGWSGAAMAAADLAAKLGESVESVLEQAARGFVATKGTKASPEWWAENFERYLEAGREAPLVSVEQDRLKAEQARLVDLAATADPETQAELHAQIRDIAAKRRQLKGAA